MPNSAHATSVYTVTLQNKAAYYLFCIQQSILCTCRDPNGNIEDILSDPAFQARTRVHEYGGGEYVVGKDAVYFSNFKCV